MTRRARREARARYEAQRQDADPGATIVNRQLVEWAVARLDDAPEGTELERQAAGLIRSLTVRLPPDVHQRVRGVLGGRA